MKIFIFTALMFSALAASGCGADGDRSVNVNSGTAVNAPTLANSPSNNSTAVNSGQLEQYNASANSTAAGNYGSNSKTRTLVDEPGSKPTQKPAAVLAPENSTVSIGMNEAGAFVETRIFNGDSSIAKVEKLTNGNDRRAKIYLKSGTAVSVNPIQIPLINAIALSKLRELAGISVPADGPGPGAATEKPKQ